MDYKKVLIEKLVSLLELDYEVIEQTLEIPKEKSHGDFAFPCFILSKTLRKAPQQIANELEEKFSTIDSQFSAKAIGPYLNFTLESTEFVQDIIINIQKNKQLIPQVEQPSIVLIESPGQNTNKPLHLGHLRNMLLGASISTILRSIGKEVHNVNVINDRGIHICKSMIAYQKWGEGKTPESEQRKSDHFVGDWYVRYSQEIKNNPQIQEQLENETNQMLLDWEEGKPEVMALWKTMNTWAFEGYEETYKRLDFTIEKDYFESETYTGGKDIILQGVKDGIFYKDETGAVLVDLTDKKLDKKVLLRSNGTSVYITQDINMAHLRYKDYTFDEMIYIVGNEQEYHFKVLFEIFKKLGWSFGDTCKHFSYGMIELPSGKMKSREGNVIDTDELIENTIALAKEGVEERYSDLSDEEIQLRAEIIGMGALRFFFLKNDPVKNFVFDPKASLSFEGETGPYVQYTHARICSIIRKAEEFKQADLTVLIEDEEKDIAKLLAQYGEVVRSAGEELKPNAIANYLIKLCQAFNSYYSKHKVVQEDKEVEHARIALLQAITRILKEGLALLGIQAPERM